MKLYKLYSILGALTVLLLVSTGIAEAGKTDWRDPNYNFKAVQSAWIEDIDFKDPDTGQLLNRELLNQELSKIEKAAGIANPKDFRNEVVKFTLRARAGHGGRNPSWTSYEKIRDVIGKGGATIRALTEETGCTIDIGEDGTITIASTDADKAAYARKRIEEITAEAEVGKVYEGPVVRLLDFGAIVNIMPGRDGLLHVSQIANERVNNVSDYVKEGQVVRVKVLETDERGKIRLSMKALLNENAG